MKRHAYKFLSFIIAFIMLVLVPMTALAGNNIGINNKTYSFDVAGNGIQDDTSADYGRLTSLVTATDSNIQITTATVTNGCNVYGAYADVASSTGADASYNVAVLYKSTVAGDVYGGYSVSGETHENKAQITNNSVVEGNVYGGYASHTGYPSREHEVFIQGFSTVEGSVYGGYSVDGDAYASFVRIENCTIIGAVYGGYCSATNRSAYNNEVRIVGTSTLTNVDIYGGVAATSTNNTLDLRTASVSVRSVEAFQNIDFNLPSGVTSGVPILNVASETELSGHATYPEVTVTIKSCDAPLQLGDKITLISNVTGTPTNINSLMTASRYVFELSIEGGALIATVKDILSPSTSSIFWVTNPESFAQKTTLPANGEVVGKRINVYKLETLKSTLFRLNKGEAFTILGLANNGRSLSIEANGSEGYIALKDIKASFNSPLKATALKKANAYSLSDSGKYKRIGYYDKNQVLSIYGITGKYLINKQPNATYYLDASQWRLSLN